MKKVTLTRMAWPVYLGFSHGMILEPRDSCDDVSIRPSHEHCFVKRLFTESEDAIQYIGIEQKVVPLKKRDGRR